MTVDEAFEKGRMIGVIGSPSSTNKLTVDILEEAVDTKLVGALSVLRYEQDKVWNYGLGQITEVNLQNPWIQDPTMRGIIRRRGRVEPITERQDVHNASMSISSVFSVDGEVRPSILGTVPCTGTPIRLLSEMMMDSLFHDQRKDLFYLGRTYEGDIKMPMWLKHFGRGDMGAGEAYHIGIFGKTGSGKSVLASMMVAGYAKHKGMNILILDPQGQFSRDFESGALKNVMSSLGKTPEIIGLHDLVLTGDNLFKMVLIASGFLRDNWNIKHPDNQSLAANKIVSIMNLKSKQGRLGDNYGETENRKIGAWLYHERTMFDRVVEHLISDENAQKTIYTSDGPRKNMVETIRMSDKESTYREWSKICKLFSSRNTNTHRIDSIVDRLGSGVEGKVLIIDLSETKIPQDIMWNDTMKFIVLGEFFKKIIDKGEKDYKDGNLLNTLVVLDEAHRLAPKEQQEDEILKGVKSKLIDAVRTTRKYGLGWMFVSQTLSSLDKEIINQMRLFMFGFGLAWGTEQQSLKDIIGGNKDALELYKLFKDPQSYIGKKEYSFMAIGPISPLSFSGAPLFFSALDYPNEFLSMNFGRSDE